MSKSRIIHNQIGLFGKLKQKFDRVQPGQRFNAHLADHFCVNEETVRRWTKGEAAIDLDLTERLCQMLSTTLNEINGQKVKGKLQVDFNFLDNENYTFESYIQNLSKTLEMGMQLPQFTMHYSAKDLPIFYYFHYKELAAFKIFVWRKMVINEPELKKKTFSPDMFNDTRIMDYGCKALDSFNRIHTVEVWNDEIINSIIKQIIYFVEIEDVAIEMGITLLKQLKLLVENIEEMAEHGQKFDVQNPEIKTGNFELYYNEIVLCDNSVVLDMGEQVKAFVPYQTLNLMHVDDYEFGRKSLEKISILQKRFDKLSQSNEGHRKKVFSRMRSAVNNAMVSLA
ncbi:MAG: hypothetical protein SGJ10_08825 [Bacteroidota bacterium]|nr:hypothetical protein [Bacteroidota bacterium]